MIPQSPQIYNKLKRSDLLFQHFQNLNQERKALEFYQLLSTNNQIIYVDQAKQFAIVRTKYLQELQRAPINANKHIDDVMDNVRNQHVEKAQFNKIIEMKNKNMEEYRTLMNAANLKAESLQKRLNANMELLNQKQNELNTLSIKYEKQLKEKLSKIPAGKVKIEKDTRSVQTEFDLKAYQLSLRDNIQNSASENNQKAKQGEEASLGRYESEIARIKNNFENMLGEITGKMELKLQQIEKEKLMIQNWSQENKKLKEENQRLQQQIYQINQQEEKVKIWKSTLQDFVENVEKDYQQEVNRLNISTLPSGLIESNPKDHINQEKIKLMQATIDRLQAQERIRENKAKEIKDIIETLEDSSSISEQNIVGNIVSLSFKLKEVIKFLLEEV